MDIAVEISMYPLSKDYLAPIQDFIDRLHADDRLIVQTNTMSTQVLGDYDVVWDALREAMRISLHAGPKAVFVTKFLPRDA